MASLKVVATPFERVVNIPSSKSYTNRYLILASLYPGTVILQNYSHAQDVLQLVDLLQQVGLNITRGEGDIVIHNSFPQCESSSPQPHLYLETGEGGTTNRFLVALLSKGKKRYRLHAHGPMVERPMGPLYDLLKTFKVDIVTPTPHSFPVEIQGPALFHHREVEVDCTQSTQFLSALELTYCDSPIRFIPQNLNGSEGYYHLTQNIIKTFYFEKQNRNFTFFMPVDFSSLTYPVALAALNGHLLVRNCQFIDMLQPDSYFLTLLCKMGGSYSLSPHGLEVRKAHELKGVEVDCKSCPDLIPTLSLLCSYAQSPSVLKGLELLRYKESNRIDEIIKLLTLFEVPHYFNEENCALHFRGNAPKVGPKEYEAPADHRMVMAGHLFMRANNGGVLHNFEAIKKSFPEYLDVMEN